jgi:hypothetical protein
MKVLFPAGNDFSFSNEQYATFLEVHESFTIPGFPSDSIVLRFEVNVTEGKVSFSHDVPVHVIDLIFSRLTNPIYHEGFIQLAD